MRVPQHMTCEEGVRASSVFLACLLGVGQRGFKCATLGAFSHSAGTARAQRQLLRCLFQEHPLHTTPPTEACMIHSKQPRGC